MELFKISKQSSRLHDIISIDSELNKIQDLDILLERTLTWARRMVNADAGSLYLHKDKGLQINYSQNDTLQADLLPGQKLIYSIFSVQINKQTISGYCAATKEIVNIKDVYHLPPDAPYTYDTKFDLAAGYRTISMLSVPLVSIQGELLGVLQLINKKLDNKIGAFTLDDEAVARHFANNVVVALDRARMTRAILLRMIQMAELRDPKETGAHVNRVAGYAVEIYEQWAVRHKLPEEKIQKDKDNLRMAAMLHDVGKVAISDIILKKSGSFTPEERKIMETHTISGAKLFLAESSEFDQIAMSVALNHHENWDGSGYPGFIDLKSGLPSKVDRFGKPLGKKAYEIPLYGRIVSIADVYDALRSARIYKKAWQEEDVLKEIEKLKGSKFDPELVDIFFSVYPSLQTIAARYQE